MLPIPVVILSVALFLALIANLALKPAFSTRLTAKCMIFAALAGLVIYGVGFAETTGSLAVSILRTPLSVTRMFVGINELSAIEGSTPVRTPMGVTIFWLVHMLAFFSTASAALVTIGAEVLRRLRLLLLRRGDLVILFGINDNTINVGKECLAYPTAIGYESSDTPEEQERQRRAWQTVQRGHAVANGLPVVTVNRVGHEPDPSGQTKGILFWGTSFVAGPQGEIIYEASADEEESIIVEMDMERSEQVRRWWPFLRDRRIDHYGDITKRYIDKQA